MELRLQKWGNSSRIRIPSSVLKQLNLKVNDKLELLQEDDKIIITKSKSKKISLKERFENFKGKNLVEFEWDEPQGREIW